MQVSVSTPSHTCRNCFQTTHSHLPLLFCMVWLQYSVPPMGGFLHARPSCCIAKRCIAKRCTCSASFLLAVQRIPCCLGSRAVERVLYIHGDSAGIFFLCAVHCNDNEGGILSGECVCSFGAYRRFWSSCQCHQEHMPQLWPLPGIFLLRGTHAAVPEGARAGGCSPSRRSEAGRARRSCSKLYHC